MPNLLPMNPTPAIDFKLLPHEKLLADCVSAAGTGNQLHADIREVDWPAFVTASVRHGVAQPVASLLLESDLRDRIPTAAQAAMKRLVAANRSRNLAIYAETSQVLQALQLSGIEAIVLKGVALSLLVYEDFAHRNFADVDILVRAIDLVRAQQIAASNGWQLQDGEVEPGHHHVIFERHVEKDILSGTLAPEFDPTLTPSLLAPHLKRIRLEIHQSPFFDISGAATPADLSPFWEGRQSGRFPDGTPFAAPALEAMFVHLCFHAASHGFQKAQFFLDCALVLRRYANGMNPSRLDHLARRYHAQKHVLQVLRFLESEMGLLEASQMLKELPDEPSATLTWVSVIEVMYGGRSETRLRHWMATGSFRGKLRGAIRMIVPGPAAMRRIYGIDHPLLLVSLYVWRPFQLTGRLLKIAARAGLRSHGSRG